MARKLAKVIQVAGTDRMETGEELTQRKIAKIIRRSSEFISLPEKLAEDKFAYRNWGVPSGEELFPNEWRARFVSLYFPFSPGGPLMVDTPIMQSDIELCQKKAVALKAAGHRYVYIVPMMTEAEAREQLGEI